jgi:hypothetical protein
MYDEYFPIPNSFNKDRLRYLLKSESGKYRWKGNPTLSDFTILDKFLSKIDDELLYTVTEVSTYQYIGPYKSSFIFLTLTKNIKSRSNLLHKNNKSFIALSRTRSGLYGWGNYGMRIREVPKNGLHHPTKRSGFYTSLKYGDIEFIKTRLLNFLKHN